MNGRKNRKNKLNTKDIFIKLYEPKFKKLDTISINNIASTE